MASNLKDVGFRFVRRQDGSFNWTHPLEVSPGDVDCTEMSDEEFERFVLEGAAS